MIGRAISMSSRARTLISVEGAQSAVESFSASRRRMSRSA
jgi:hypothetical protein